MKRSNKRIGEIKLVAFLTAIMFSLFMTTQAKVPSKVFKLPTSNRKPPVTATTSYPTPTLLFEHAQYIMETSVAEAEEPETVDLPDVDTSVKTYMDYRTITNKKSKQWALQEKATTNEDGLRMLDGKYLVAMGTFYSDHVGRMYQIILENGTTFDVIIGDIKDDKDTDANNQHKDGNVVEFIVDRSKMPRDSKLMGDVSYTPGAGLMGPIRAIVYLGEYSSEAM